MRVILADVAGMCFGVRAALRTLDGVAHPGETTIHGELVHNEIVLTQLGARGFRMVGESQRDPLPETRDVLITAHGISQRERRRLEEAGKNLIDTTCPLVTRAHDAAQRLQAEGCFVLVIGRRGHVEVQGIIEDLTDYEVVQHPGEVRAYGKPRLGILCQTTVPESLVQSIREAVAQRNANAEVRFLDTVCQPTKDHQTALRKLLQQVQAMVVVGGMRSNNTRAMVAHCQEQGISAHHVRCAADLNPEWFEEIDVVGLTAGTSTLDESIEEVRFALERIAHDKLAPVA